ncbi:MAG: HlyC/CorC family transporter [Hyphomicrobiaceae bacterium]|nr:HlyC/CorC family transporter [Hyphomicrobiaceae bacterium]
MSLEIILALAAILVLLVLSAFFNGSETALTAASRARMHALEQEGNSRAGIVNELIRHPEKMIGAILIGNTVVDVLAASLATGLGVALFGPAGIVYATTLVSLCIIIFSSVLPKSYAMASSDKAALSVAPILRRIVWLLTPVTIAIEFVVRQLLKLTPSKADDEANILAAHEEIRGTIELGTQGGAFQRVDAEMLGGILDLRDLQVLDVMVHRTKMETIDSDEPPRQVVEAVLASQYTRVPVWRGQPENIVGVLHTKDLLAALAKVGWNADKVDIGAVLAEPWFVPDTTSLKEQLRQFLARKTQLALVVDEYGEVQGLVTLEDIIEEIVGQISDEHDTHETQIRPQADGSVSVEGTMAIRDLNRAMGWDLPDEAATTIAGLVMHEAQMIPEVGQAFTFYGYRFEIVRKQRNRVTGVRVRRLGDQTRPRSGSRVRPEPSGEEGK